MMNYIVFDLEATCWKQWNSKNQNEIIEIGAVKVNREGYIVSEFDEFVKPKLFPELSEFCTNLTTIKQSDVDNADYFPAVVERFKNWINVEEDFFLCSWGFYDKNQLIKDSQLFHLETDWLKNHISLKHQFTSIKKLKRDVGMKEALKIEKMRPEGTHHRGIDDARNIAKVFVANMFKWDFSENNNSTNK